MKTLEVIDTILFIILVTIGIIQLNSIDKKLENLEKNSIEMVEFKRLLTDE